MNEKDKFTAECSINFFCDDLYHFLFQFPCQAGKISDLMSLQELDFLQCVDVIHSYRCNFM